MKNIIVALLFLLFLFQLSSQSIFSQSIFDTLTLPRILNKNDGLIFVNKQALKDFQKEKHSKVPKQLEGAESAANFINFDDVPWDGTAHPIARNRYPGVSFYAPYSNSYTFVIGNYNSSVSFPNKLIVGSINPNGYVENQSPLVVYFSQLSKDVSLYVTAGGCSLVNIDVYQRGQFLRTVHHYFSYDFDYIEFNDFSQKISSLIIYYGCQPQYGLSPYMAIDDVSFQANPFDPPIGYIDDVNDEKGAYGWSVDPDNTSASNTVDCYIDNNNIGNFPANVVSPDLQYPGNHRFEIPIPAQYRDGNQHEISCYGTDVVGDAPPTLLMGSPKTFTLNPAVQSVAFESVTNQVINQQLTNSEIDHPTSGYNSQRIFPDAKIPDDPINHKTVRVKAVVGKPNVMVYFKNYDVDDPSDDPDIDDPTSDGTVTNGSNAGKDNREGRVIGQPYPVTAAGVLSAASALTNAAGEAVVYFTVTKQPGDNFVVAASTDDNYLTGIKINGTGLKDSSNKSLPTIKAKRTELLTVWRKVHIEKDSMGVVTNNFVTGYFAGKGTYIGSEPKWIEIYSSTIFEVNTYKDILADDGTYSYGGRMDIAGVHSLQVVDSEPFGTAINNIPSRQKLLVKSLNGNVYLRPNHPFKLYDDDDFNSNDGAQKDGDNGEDVDYLSDTLSHMRTSDNIDENAYAAAYIMPEYEWANQPGINNSNVSFVPFIVNCASRVCDTGLPFINNNRGSATMERDDFWVGYLLVAYQPDDSLDLDPTGGLSGIALSNDNRLDVSNRYDEFGVVPRGKMGAISFIEVMRDSDFKLPPFIPGPISFKSSLARTRTAPHELGHQFGLAGDTEKGYGVMSYDEPLIFVGDHINLMRWRVKSPGME